MTRLFGDPDAFKDDAIEGLTAAYGRYVRRVPAASGFVRADGPSPGNVSLIVGGGSGHYPSYGGIVGPGFATGCVLGDIFTSPSAEQVYRIATACHGGAGLVMSFGNYAGDRMNFAAAQQRLTREGIEARIVYVTDDVASAPPERVDERRGIAGTFVVYKIGGAACDAGADLDEVERVMRAANAATFTFGVAFAGCTFPGSSDPLFTVEPGHMDLGLGIHGEPGIETAPWMPVDQLATQLVDRVMAERAPSAGPRAAVLLNGLGATKYEELFVLYGHVQRRLDAAGVETVLPEVGELVTSLDMAGCSLTVTWLDDELGRLWLAPADTAAFRRWPSGTSSDWPNAGSVDATVAKADRIDGPIEVDPGPIDYASAESIAAAGFVRDGLTAMVATLERHEGQLGRLDAIAGDGDHGVGMVRGARGARRAVEQFNGGLGSTIVAAGRAFGDDAGGTSGMLWGVFLVAIGESVGNTDVPTPAGVCEALAEGASAIARVGAATLGDKTMLDALCPFVDELTLGTDDGTMFASAWSDAVAVATSAAAATAGLTPKVGRARPLAERSVGTPDPGATSMALVLDALSPIVAGSAEAS